MPNLPDPVAANLLTSAGNGAGNGPSGTTQPADVPARPPGPGTRPAAVVLGIILVIFVLGAVGAGLTSSHSAGTSKASATSSATVAGTGGLSAEAGRLALAPIVSAGQPPSDILGAVVVPMGSRYVPGSVVNQAVGLFDSTLRFDVPAPEQSVIMFYRAELAAARWHVVSQAPASSGYRLIAQHPSSDGYEWELGVTLAPTAFTAAVTGMSVPGTGLTPMSLRLFAVSDQS
ncbi:MAG: hypothetical protein ACYDD6_10800 [Acidimicrobiales bacterium]